MKNSPFYERARLMTRLLPYVAAEADFAMKGGSAINFFVRDMPRLSIAIPFLTTCIASVFSLHRNTQ